MRPVASKSSLTPSRKWIVEQMQNINFGRIEKLFIQNGEPQLDPVPRVIKEVKFNGDNKPRAEFNFNDFALKSEIREFFSLLDQLENGYVESIEVKYGLPFHMSIEVSIRS